MVNQFDIYWIDLNPTRGGEINKKRPCAIISPNEMNKYLNTIMIAPLTSTIKNYPTRVDVLIGNKKGQIALDQIRSINQTRLSNKLDILKKEYIIIVKKVLLEMFK
ncbi:MAG: type II toxin-antitoxin system PemK/MazF family toxin [Polaribacter sp.]